LAFPAWQMHPIEPHRRSSARVWLPCGRLAVEGMAASLSRLARFTSGETWRASARWLRARHLQRGFLFAGVDLQDRQASLDVGGGVYGTPWPRRNGRGAGSRRSSTFGAVWWPRLMMHSGIPFKAIHSSEQLVSGSCSRHRCRHRCRAPVAVPTAIDFVDEDQAGAVLLARLNRSRDTAGADPTKSQQNSSSLWRAQKKEHRPRRRFALAKASCRFLGGPTNRRPRGILLPPGEHARGCLAKRDHFFEVLPWRFFHAGDVIEFGRRFGSMAKRALVYRTHGLARTAGHLRRSGGPERSTEPDQQQWKSRFKDAPKPEGCSWGVDVEAGSLVV